MTRPHVVRYRLKLATWIVVRERIHPSPSREDLRLTRQLADGARLLDLRLHDHIIVGNGTEQWVSLAQRGDL